MPFIDTLKPPYHPFRRNIEEAILPYCRRLGSSFPTHEAELEEIDTNRQNAVQVGVHGPTEVA
ncbi:MAG: hypothetical protein JO235_26355 [Chroococcidiopsidaceae cyanobacterium CP_BM_RX_35]|nr:hypothetical protein [Chroococcidiopsidaceae cyanobacterium CP_BM_RX_35]